MNNTLGNLEPAHPHLKVCGCQKLRTCVVFSLVERQAEIGIDSQRLSRLTIETDDLEKDVVQASLCPYLYRQTVCVFSLMALGPSA